MTLSENLAWKARRACAALLGLIWIASAAAASPPRDLSATAAYGSRVDLHWQAASSSVRGYRVSRGCRTEGEDAYCPLAELTADARSYRDLAVVEGHAYEYQVEAMGESGNFAAFVRVVTPARTHLPRDRSGDDAEAVYFEPQGAWRLGEKESLARIRTVRMGHNLERDEDLGVLLRPPGSVDPKAPCRAHSLPGRLRAAGFKTARGKSPTPGPNPGTAEIDFVDLSRDFAQELSSGNWIPEFEAMGDEGYVLRAQFVGPDALRIVVGAHTPKGLFHGGMTVQRLLVEDTLCSPRKELEPVIVLDYPDHRFRGASPDWGSMTSNRSRVPEDSLDMLDALARSGATEVDWGSSWAAQEAYSWDREGAKAAAAVQIAAAERFMTVKYRMGFSAIGFGKTNRGSGVPGDGPRISFNQALYGDGLAVVNEPFSWFETQPGRFEALAQRKGTRLDADPAMEAAPFRPVECNWRTMSASQGETENADERGWRLEGPARKCRLVRAVDGSVLGAGSGLEDVKTTVWLRASPEVGRSAVTLGFEGQRSDGSRVWIPVSSPKRLSSDEWKGYAVAVPESVHGSEGERFESLQFVVEAEFAEGALWVRAASPWRPVGCKEGGDWRFRTRAGENESSRSGWTLTGAAMNCRLVQELGPLPASDPDGYLLTARVEVSEKAVGVEGSVALEVDSKGGPLRWPVSIPPEAGDGSAREISVSIPASAIPGGAETARIVVTGSVRGGELALRGLRLYARSVAPLALDGEARGERWAIQSGGIGLEWDRTHGRSDSSSFRVDVPKRGQQGKKVPRARWSQAVQLDAGLYLLGAWLQVDPKTAGKGSSDVFSLRADITVDLLDGLKADSKKSVRSAQLKLPKSVRRGAGRWIYYINVFRLSEEEARNVRELRVQLRALASSTEGRYWIDDIELRRLDGDLRNLLGAVKAPTVRGPSGGLYQEKLDYEICQVGSATEECGSPQNYTDILPGGWTASYDASRPPFKIRWLRDGKPADHTVRVSYDIGAQYESVSAPQVGWDGQVYTPGSLNFCDFGRVSEAVGLEAIFSRFLDGYTVKDFPRRGEEYEFKADAVTWSVSEVEGVNRSVACRGPDGTVLDSNAELFAKVVNRAFALAQAKSPETRFVLWADMFDPFHNGGDLDFQVRYGGVPGRSACSFAPGQLRSMCADEVDRVSVPIVQESRRAGEGIIMQPWTYFPDMIRRMVAISSWYEGLGVTSQVLSGSDPVNIEDWAGIAHAFGGVQGVLSNRYHARYYGGRSGVLGGLRAFWNHDWKLLYLHDNESAASSYYQIPWPFQVSMELTRATLDEQGACASSSSKFKKNNDGGLCLHGSGIKGGSSLVLSGIPAKGGRAYRVDVLALPRSKAKGRGPGPRIELLWSSGEKSGAVESELVFSPKRGGRLKEFSRYRAEFKAPSGVDSMRVEIRFPSDSSFEAADDVIIFEALEACFDDCQAREEKKIVASPGSP